VAEQLTKMFDNPHSNDEGALTWSFPKVNRNISFTPSEGGQILTVWETSTQD
jgi:hypothetical protein